MIIMCAKNLRLIERVQLRGNELQFPAEAVELLGLRPEDYVEIYVHAGLGSMEFCGLSKVDDKHRIALFKKLVSLLPSGAVFHFYVGENIAVARLEDMSARTQVPTSRRMETMGTTRAGKEPPVTLRFFRHVCEVRGKNQPCGLCGFGADKKLMSKAPPRIIPTKKTARPLPKIISSNERS
jgi:hypothetical protein